jgi:16S rRNA (uracil1498-N3)-methyltransferase
MQLPFFFEENLPVSDEFNLTEETSRHIVQVLRMNEREELLVTNGKGETLKAFITSANKKRTGVKITGRTFLPRDGVKVSIAISPLKNKSRFEWFLEKATELGVSEIIPLICHRTENQHFNPGRMNNILVSAMVQSQQAWLPSLSKPVKFAGLVNSCSQPDRFIAHCLEGNKVHLGRESGEEAIQKTDRLILIGPEGDFTKDEVEIAMQHNFIPVTLGDTRLRTETAGLVAAVLLLNK